ncbi:hypothetical protein RhiirA5_505983 [Rhizophagus irregularis]|uniref:BAH domain-containing protein n=1 Tax=Rhizophagus irregularis TaxID=588596 RepID=A0A2N0NWG1_9GLOM|nr:hypothetical protein RhiirA5_505983 [Rhizophagus irregularis]
MATTRNDGSTEMDIYDDEDEEMTTTIDIENEEISEDELESEYERIMIEFNENDEDENERGGDSDEEVIIDQPDEEVIVDQPLSSEQLSYSSDIIRNILNNPLLFSNMYFRPGQEVTKNKELWHGDIWKESARFGKTSITIAQHVYYSGDFVVYRESSDAKRFGRILAIVQKDDRLIIKIQRIIRFEELPGNLQSNNRKERSQDNEVWFLDREMEDAVMNVELHAIVGHAPITIHYDNSNNRHSIKIQEILYKHNGRWKLRDVKYSYQHPSEFAPLDEPETHLPIYKLFIDLYYDDFGIFRNVYHSLGGVYVQIGNMLFTERNRLKNHFVLGFVPFGGSFDEFIKPFITEMKVLERGKILNIQGNECVVIASLGDTTADLPQGNDMAGVKRHSAVNGRISSMKR